MKELMFSQTGFWVVFTMLFMFVFLGYFVYKMVKLSGEKNSTAK
jgi:F0F1-type ATP synthase membrane subunit b/b'